MLDIPVRDRTGSHRFDPTQALVLATLPEISCSLINVEFSPVQLMSISLVLAAGAHRDAAGGFLALAVLFGAGYVVLSFFFRRVGGIDPKTGKPGGSEKASVGAWFLLAAIAVGILIATR